MKGFKIAFIACFGAAGFFFLTGCVLPPLFIMCAMFLIAAFVFLGIFKKTRRNRSGSEGVEVVESTEAKSAVEIVSEPTPVAPVESSDAVAQATESSTWTCACGAVVDGNFCTKCGASKDSAPTTESSTWTCACGAVVEGNFCTKCGAAKNAAPATDVAPNTETTSEEDVFVASSMNEKGEEVIDLSPFPVHEENIEFDATSTKYKFVHATGFVGSIPQKFVDTKMEKCPYCCKKPIWDFTQIRLKTWRGNINVFKCSECQGAFSISVMDISTALDLAANYANGLNLVNMAAKKKAGKEAHTAYVTFENVGNSGVCPDIQGKEVRLQDAIAISRRR